MLKAFIFDMDGVLIDSMPDHADAWKTVLAGAGVNITKEDIYEIEGSNHEGVIRLMFEKAGKNPEARHFDELPEQKREIFRRTSNLKAFEGINRCLNVLKKKYSLAVVSGSDRIVVQALIEKFFPDIFEVIISGEDVKEGKPSPEPYLKAVQMLRIKAEEALVIENAPLGVESAKRAGLYCVAIPTYVEPATLEKADKVLKNHAALFRYLADIIAAEDK